MSGMESGEGQCIHDVIVKTRHLLSAENLMEVYNPILEKILKKLDFHSLLNFARAIFGNEGLLMEIDNSFEIKEAEHWLPAKPALDGWPCTASVINLKVDIFRKQELKNLIIADFRNQIRFKGMACLKVKMGSLPDSEYFIYIRSESFLLFRRWEHSDIADKMLSTFEIHIDRHMNGPDILRAVEDLTISYQI